MAKRTHNNKSNKGWIFGTVLGAVAGAAYALWKTPMSGEELRGKLAPGPVSTSSHAPAATSGGFSDKIMSTVERTLAPIVGVELGRTANSTPNGSHEVTEPISVNTVQADTSASNSLRSRRFEWGSPAPDVNDTVQTPSAPETVAVEPNLPEAAPERDAAERTTTHATESAATSTYRAESDGFTESTEATRDETESWGTGTLRSNRFAWGDTAPEAMATTQSAQVAPAGHAASEADTTEVDPLAANRDAHSGDVTRFSDSNASIETDSSEGTVDPLHVSAAANSTGTLHPFPKLGGMEDNA